MAEIPARHKLKKKGSPKVRDIVTAIFNRQDALWQDHRASLQMFILLILLGFANIVAIGLVWTMDSSEHTRTRDDIMKASVSSTEEHSDIEAKVTKLHLAVLRFAIGAYQDNDVQDSRIQQLEAEVIALQNRFKLEHKVNQ